MCVENLFPMNLQCLQFLDRVVTSIECVGAACFKLTSLRLCFG